MPSQQDTVPSQSGSTSKRWIVHVEDHPYECYIGRDKGWGITTVYGNPFMIKDYNDPQDRVRVIEAHKRYMLADEQRQLVTRAKKELRGKVLGCHCKARSTPDLACHGDFLRLIAEESEEETEERRRALRDE